MESLSPQVMSILEGGEEKGRWEGVNRLAMDEVKRLLVRDL